MTSKTPVAPQATFRFLVCLACSSVLALAAGCTGGSAKLVPVEGKVTLNNKPVTSGVVTLLPEGKTALPTGNPTGEIQSDGAYKLTTGGKAGAPLGKYKVTITPAPTKAGDINSTLGKTPPKGVVTQVSSGVPQKYESGNTTDLTIEVTDGKKDYPLDLK